MFVTLIVFILILGLLIFVHELGHFLTAKRAGIKVEEFAFGFPPRLYAIKKGETEYALNLLPIGGYVKMLGEEEDASKTELKNNRSFAHQSVWVRSGVVVAGVLMNIVLAWLLITIGFMIGMRPIASEPAQIPFGKVQKAIVIVAVASATPAETMGIKPNDHIISFNGLPIDQKAQLPELTKQNKGKEVTLTVTRNGQTLDLKGTLGTGEGPLGVRIEDETATKLPFWWAPIYGLWETLKAAGLIFVGILGFFKELFTTASVPAGAAGPVGIFYYTRGVLDLGVSALISFVAVLSINLAMINILPVPALDGGKLLFIVLEKFNKGKKIVNQRLENIAHTIGFVLLIALIITVTYNDILQVR